MSVGIISHVEIVDMASACLGLETKNLFITDANGRVTNAEQFLTAHLNTHSCNFPRIFHIFYSCLILNVGLVCIIYIQILKVNKKF
jgi:hypothetical protein